MDFNPLSPKVTANPSPYCAELRGKAPVSAETVRRIQARARSRGLARRL